tara:strand:- start:2026 stop:2718 length:693 start_codon:yes stop_codon:yes gene_type:complete
MATILVTGANRGLGIEFVEQYLNEGNEVIATYRSENSSIDLFEMGNERSNLKLLQLDVSSNKSLDSFAENLGNSPIDIFINNAGVYGPRNSSFGNVDEENWIPAIKINAIAPVLLTQLIIKNIRAGTDKKLIYITSKMGSIDDNKGGGAYVYRGSKTALNAVVKSLSVDLKNENIAVALIHPGWVKTDMGGPNALIDKDTSVRGMTEVISNLDISSTGNFFNYDGTIIPW